VQAKAFELDDELQFVPDKVLGKALIDSIARQNYLQSMQ
jgi:hypothetical protein